MSVETKELQRLADWHDAKRQIAKIQGDELGNKFHVESTDLLRRVATILSAPLPPSSLPPAPPPEDEQ